MSDTANPIFYCGYCHNDWQYPLSQGHPRACPSCGRDSHIREIIVSHVYPPIPIRTMDWRAFFDGEEESNRYGYGPDRNTAINDLISNFGE